ncbi:hypothetical protein CFOL_v3_08029 [Cephalotus follicularis]|uniref:Uncharacterized protein n=1 Tax=Cephalotus follicularis TaxID=3775 RepID=A0A1Q3B910_CEPFO|nr:hypothetical protein CFOL_v3_08029 [Cephalotus follicularis]
MMLTISIPIRSLGSHTLLSDYDIKLAARIKGGRQVNLPHFIVNHMLYKFSTFPFPMILSPLCDKMGLFLSDDDGVPSSPSSFLSYKTLSNCKVELQENVLWARKRVRIGNPPGQQEVHEPQVATLTDVIARLDLL